MASWHKIYYDSEILRYRNSDNVYIRNQNNYAEFDTVVSIDFDILTDKPIKIGRAHV